MSKQNSPQKIKARIGEEVIDNNGEKIGCITEFYAVEMLNILCGQLLKQVCLV